MTQAERRLAAAGLIGVWSYGAPHWDWKKENDYLLENAEVALAYWRKDNPTKAYRLSNRKPKDRPTAAESLQPICTLHL